MFRSLIPIDHEGDKIQVSATLLEGKFKSGKDFYGLAFIVAIAVAVILMIVGFIVPMQCTSRVTLIIGVFIGMSFVHFICNYFMNDLMVKRIMKPEQYRIGCWRKKK